MNVEGVALGIVYADGTVGSFGIAERVTVEDVVASEFIAIVAVDVDDAAIGLGECAVGLVVKRIALDADTFVADNGTIKQVGTFTTGIIGAILAVDMVVTVVDIRGTNDTCKAGAGVVVQRVGDKGGLWTLEVNVVVEHGFAGGGAVLPPLTLESVVTIDHATTIEEIAEFVETVIVQGVAVEAHLVVRQDNVITSSGELVGAVVEEDVGDECQRVALIHVDIAKGIEGVGLLIVERAVASENDIVVTKADVSHQDLGITIDALVEVEFVGMEQMNQRALLPRLLIASARGRRCHDKDSHRCHDQRK